MPVTPDTPDTRDLGWAAEQTPRTDSAYSRDLISAYNGLRAFESDFDKAQGQLRAIASAWLLAGIGAIGFLTIQEFSFAKVNGATTGLAPDTAAILRQALLFFIALGIASIWKLDQKVYQKLLHSVFALGYWIEFTHAQVPPTRMMLYKHSKDITKDLGEFYSRPVSLIWICGAINLIKEIYGLKAIVQLQWPPPWSAMWASLQQTPSFSWWIGCGLLFLGHTIYHFTLLVRALRWRNLKNLLPAEADDARGPDGPLPRRQPYAGRGANGSVVGGTGPIGTTGPNGRKGATGPASVI